MKLLTESIVAFLLLALTSSCASELSATAVPDANLGKDRSYYVAHRPSDNSGVNVEICKQLNTWGRSATTGAREKTPDNLDVLVTYEDKWTWDMSLYLLSLDISFLDAMTEEEIARGRCLRTSLIRENQEWQTNAVLTEVFKKIYPDETPPADSKQR